MKAAIFSAILVSLVGLVSCGKKPSSPGPDVSIVVQVPGYPRGKVTPPGDKDLREGDLVIEPMEVIHNGSDDLEYVVNGQSLGSGRKGEAALLALLAGLTPGTKVSVDNPRRHIAPALSQERIDRPGDPFYPSVPDAATDLLVRKELDRIRSK